MDEVSEIKEQLLDTDEYLTVQVVVYKAIKIAYTEVYDPNNIEIAVSELIDDKLT